MSNLKVKVSNPMAKAIKTALNGIAFDVEIGKMNIELYQALVDYDALNHTEDWDAKANKLKVIRIEYPADCYAMPTYITTKDLTRIFRNSDHTYNGFMNEIRNEYAI